VAGGEGEEGYLRESEIARQSAGREASENRAWGLGKVKTEVRTKTRTKSRRRWLAAKAKRVIYVRAR
jgi:hypothetical protein